MSETAPPIAPTELYHYTSFDPSRLENILYQSKIYCSNPSHFNDPWDCKPDYYIPNDEETDIRERYIIWFQSAWERHFGEPITPALMPYADLLRTNRVAFEAIVRQFSVEFQIRVAKAYRVFCLSASATNTLLWSHYAKHHTGIALEFGRQNDVFCSAIRVRYAHTYPRYDVAANIGPANVLPMLVKSSVWSYEEEYRLIALEKGEGKYVAGSMRSKAGFISIAPRALKSIILGCQFPETQVSVIKNIVGARFPVVALKRTRRALNSYDLIVEPL